jgi:(p)ppGpp synthase/HD superfamily hydrolase
MYRSRVILRSFPELRTMKQLTDRFLQALDYAFFLHKEQTRKGSQTPYVAHLLAVTALVIEDGGTEDEAIAALLHDAPEDQGGKQILEQIQLRFGDRVAAIVDGCTDTYENPKPTWRLRKDRYLHHLQTAPADIRRVSLADKLHNASTILRDLKLSGETVWDRFNGGKQGTLWYYHSLLDIFRENGSEGMVSELERVVSEIERLSPDGIPVEFQD